MSEMSPLMSTSMFGKPGMLSARESWEWCFNATVKRMQAEAKALRATQPRDGGEGDCRVAEYEVKIAGMLERQAMRNTASESYSDPESRCFGHELYDAPSGSDLAVMMEPSADVKEHHVYIFVLLSPWDYFDDAVYGDPLFKCGYSGDANGKRRKALAKKLGGTGGTPPGKDEFFCIGSRYYHTLRDARIEAEGGVWHKFLAPWNKRLASGEREWFDLSSMTRTGFRKIVEIYHKGQTVEYSKRFVDFWHGRTEVIEANGGKRLDDKQVCEGMQLMAFTVQSLAKWSLGEPPEHKELASKDDCDLGWARSLKYVELTL